METVKDTVVGGMAYPLNSKRLKLRHIQHLASALDLPIAATRSGLEVMINGKLVETSRDTSSIQVVIVQTGEGEYLSLRDMKGTFLVTSVLPVPASRSPTSSHEDSDYKEGTESFTAEMMQLENLLQLLEEETMVLRAELQSTKEEVRQLRIELDNMNCRLVDLWEENCKQLLDHDVAMTEKEKEMRLLREQLQMREMELARMKLTNLREAVICNGIASPEVSSQTVIADDHSGELPYKTTKPSTMQSTTIPVKESLFPSIRISGNEMPTSFVEEGSQRVPASKTDANLPARRVRTMQLPLEQRGHVATSATTTTTTNLYPSEHVVTSSLTTITNTSPGVVTSSTTNPFQGRGETQVVNTAKDPQSLEVNDQSLILQNQSNQQVTNLSTSLSDMLYVSRPISSVGTVDQGKPTLDGHAYIPRRGKAPPIDPFTAEDIRITFDDWLPILERAAIWNEWTPEESLMQLAGHLRGRALQEWKLLLPEEKANNQAAIKALKERLDPGNQTLAALDFRHLSQKLNEPVSNLIGRLEKVFQIGFGQENLSKETREMLLYGQLQEGLTYTLMESPAVSGAQDYKGLCLAAKREERRLAELKRKQQHLKGERPQVNNSGNQLPSTILKWPRPNRRSGNCGTGNKTDQEGNQQRKQLRCYICDSLKHLASQCQQQKTESLGKKTTQNQSHKTTSGTRVIRTGSHMSTKKSGSCCVEVMIEGVPVTGLIDTGSDITIIRGDLFYQIIPESGLKVESLKPAEQKACTYDQKPITLDGRMDMKVSFGDKTIIATVYVKLVAPDQLLLSESVCRHLGIVNYHPNVQSVEVCQPVEEPVCDMNAPCAATTGEGESCELKNDQALPPVDDTLGEVTNKHIQPVNKGLQSSEQLPNSVKQDVKSIASSAQVRLISAVRLPANHAAAVPVKINEIRGSALIESDSLMDGRLQVDQSIVEVNKDGLATLLITNNGKLPCQLQSGVELARACEVDVEMLGDTNQTQETMSCAELPEVSSLSEYDETSEQAF